MKKPLSVLLAVLMLFAVIPANAWKAIPNNDETFGYDCSEPVEYDEVLPSSYGVESKAEDKKPPTKEIYSGECGNHGNNVIWTLDTSTGVLTISGSGDMDNRYCDDTFAPWSEWRSSILRIILLPGVTSIGGYAFEDCTSLASVTIPNSVTSIGDYAFAFCTSLSSVTIPNSVTRILGGAFSCCTSLTSVTIPDSVTSIGGSAFFGCTSLASVTIPNSVTSIGSWTFRNCTSLTSVTIPNSVRVIEIQAFCNCTSLASAYFLGDPPASIGNNAFFNTAAGFTIYYPIDKASSWAPNGETTWSGYPIAPFDGTVADGTVTTPYRLSPGDDPSGRFHVEFDDNWFIVPSNVFNYDLAKASLAAASGSFSRDNDPNDDYVRQTLTAFRFDPEYIFTEKFDDNTSIENTCAHAFAIKELPNGDHLIVAAIRSSGYGSEWESNFNVMPGNNSYLYSLGFKEAADGAYANLERYINNQCSRLGIDRNRLHIWTFGFSRGGAVANLLAARLNEESGIPQSQIFAYTFAFPKTVMRSAQVKYDNIFNILQETDAVPHVPLRTWDYTWYGNNYYLPSRTKTGKPFKQKLNVMEERFDQILAESGRSDVEYLLGESQELSIDLLLDYLDDVIRTRKIYRDQGWQEVFRSVGEIMGHAGDIDIVAILKLLLPPEVAGDFSSLCNSWSSLNYFEKAAKLSIFIAKHNFYSSYGEDAPVNQLAKMLINVLVHYNIRLRLENNNPFFGYSFTDRYNEMFDMLADAIKNKMSGELFMQHWPETYMAWLDSASDESLFELNSYTRVSLKCPIDVYVYDSNEVLVGRIVDDIADESLEESVYCACDMLGEKTVYLPDDDTYRIEIVAREDCEIDLVNEYYTDQMELASVECYLDVPMDEEQSFEADYHKDELECTLTSDGTEIEADYTVGEEEEVPEFTVELTCEGFGTIAGDGYYTLGETVSLCALELYGSTFVGWYDENGVLISTEIEYSYSITENGAFTAVFEGGRMPADADGNGVIDTTDALYVLRCALGISGDPEDFMPHCDMDDNGVIDTTDALLALRLALNIG